MALGGGMQDKNEEGGGMLHPCVPPLMLDGWLVVIEFARKPKDQLGVALS